MGVIPWAAAKSWTPSKYWSAFWFSAAISSADHSSIGCPVPLERSPRNRRKLLGRHSQIDPPPPSLPCPSMSFIDWIQQAHATTHKEGEVGSDFSCSVPCYNLQTPPLSYFEKGSVIECFPSLRAPPHRHEGPDRA